MMVNKKKLIFFCLIFSGLTERFVSFYLYQVAHFTIPAIFVECLYLFLLYKLFFQKKIFILLGGVFIISCSYYYYLGQTSGYGETLTFYLFVMSMYVITPERIKEIGFPSDTGNLFVKAAIILFIAYFISTLWGDVYYANKAEFREDKFYGFIWPHMFGYALFVISFVVSSHKKYYIAFLILAVASVSYARIATLISIVGMLGIIFEMILNGNRNKAHKQDLGFQGFNKTLFYGALIVTFGIIAVLWKDVFSVVRIFESGQVLLEERIYYDSPQVIEMTSGRSLFWGLMLENTFDFQRSFSAFFLGLSPAYVREFNELMFGLPIWMHNDWLQAMFAHGVVGFVLYTIGVIKFFKSIKFNMTVVTFFLLTSLLNGLYTYQGVAIIFLLSYAIHLRNDRALGLLQGGR